MQSRADIFACVWVLDGYRLSGPGPVGFSVSFHPRIKLMVVAHGSLTVAF